MEKISWGDFCKGLFRIIGSRPRIPGSLTGNQLLETILERRSIRKFKTDPIPPAVWDAILEAGRLAPSTVNLQTWSFSVFTAAQWQEFFAKPLPFGAQRAIIVLSDVHRAKRVITEFPYAPLCEYTVGVMNAALAAMNMTVAAEALGVASIMLSETGQTGFYDARYLAAQLKLPTGVIPLMSIVFGYAQGAKPAMPPKLPPEAVSFEGEYRETNQETLLAWHQEMQAGFSASNWGKLFQSQIAHYNRRIEEAERDLQEMIFYDGPAKF